MNKAARATALIEELNTIYAAADAPGSPPRFAAVQADASNRVLGFSIRSGDGICGITCSWRHRIK
jgi:hypothetical protein